MSIFKQSRAVCSLLVARAAIFVLCVFASGVVRAQAVNRPDAAEQLLAMANQARAQTGAPPLKWDAALAAAALAHCQRMAAAGPIAHRYGGETDLAHRAQNAGARFALIEENVASAFSAAEIHNGWMNSPEHRKNLLNPDVDRAGIAVVASRGALYAVADYVQSSPVLQARDVEERVAKLIAVSGVHVSGGSAAARAACATDRGMPSSAQNAGAIFVMRWQSADLTQLPEALTSRLAGGRYRRAEVGSCLAQGNTGAFNVYRVAVLLY